MRSFKVTKMVKVQFYGHILISLSRIRKFVFNVMIVVLGKFKTLFQSYTYFVNELSFHNWYIIYRCGSLSISTHVEMLRGKGEMRSWRGHWDAGRCRDGRCGERERDRGYRLMKSKVTSEKKLRKEGRIEGRW